jgi:hypothetical protein
MPLGRIIVLEQSGKLEQAIKSESLAFERRTRRGFFLHLGQFMKSLLSNTLGLG